MKYVFRSQVFFPLDYKKGDKSRMLRPLIPPGKLTTLRLDISVVTYVILDRTEDRCDSKEGSNDYVQCIGNYFEKEVCELAI